MLIRLTKDIGAKAARTSHVPELITVCEPAETWTCEELAVKWCGC